MSRRRKISLQVGLAIALVLALVAGFVGWSRLSHGATGTPTAASVLDGLRNADACTWLKQAMRDSVPPESGWPTDVSNWKTDTYLGWDCSVSGEGQGLMVRPGYDTEVFSGTGRSADGLPILEYGGLGASDCERSVELSSTKQNWGIVVETTKASSCDFAEKVLTRLVATRQSPPQRADAASLGMIDPCELVSRERLNSAVGALPDLPSKVSAHQCKWSGSLNVTLQLNLVKPNEVSTNAPIDLGNGMTAIPHKRVVDSIYHLDFPFRSAGDKTELVELEVQGTGEGDDEYQKVGTAAKSIMQEIINNLPKR